MKYNIGEIIIGDRIGRRPRDKYMWCACTNCGVARWVRIVRRKPRSILCSKCSRNKPYREGTRNNRLENLQLVSDDTHKSITMLKQHIKELEGRITLLEVENAGLKAGKAPIRRMGKFIWNDPIRDAPLERVDLATRTLGGGNR